MEIIGGGLAGLGLGIALRRRGVPVTLHEAGRYPRHRVCGEFMTSLDQDTKETLGLHDILLRARRATGVSWCEEGERDIRHSLKQPALCLSRHALDQAMAEVFAQSGGVLQTNSRAEDNPKEGRVRANGRSPRTASPWVGLKQHFRGLETGNDLEVHLGRGGYIGLTKVENGAVNVCGLLRRGHADLRQPMADIALQCGFRSLSRRISSAVAVPGSLCSIAGLDYRRIPRDGSLRIGDRGAMIPPFTGHGMTMALQGAVEAAGPLEAWSRGRTGWSAVCAAVAAAQKRRFRIRLLTGRLFHPLLLSSSARRTARGMHSVGLLPVAFLYRMMH